jgi:cytochrome b561
MCFGLVPVSFRLSVCDLRWRQIVAVTHYNKTQILMHWAVALLVGLSYLSSGGMKAAWWLFHKGKVVDSTTANVHQAAGIAIFVLVLVRIAMRLSRGAPEFPHPDKVWLARAAWATHALLYVLMVTVPLGGMAAWYLGVDAAGDIHGLAGNGLILLAGLHALAAIYHQFVLKDGLIVRMLRPG